MVSDTLCFSVLCHMCLLLPTQTNSYQAILITNGTHSHAVFTYQCGSMGWARADYSGATYGTIGYWADGDFFKNHPLSGTHIADEIACVNLPYTIWSNVGYQLHEETDGKLKFQTDTDMQWFSRGCVTLYSTKPMGIITYY